LNTLAAFAAE